MGCPQDHAAADLKSKGSPLRTPGQKLRIFWIAQSIGTYGNMCGAPGAENDSLAVFRSLSLEAGSLSESVVTANLWWIRSVTQHPTIQMGWAPHIGSCAPPQTRTQTEFQPHVRSNCWDLNIISHNGSTLSWSRTKTTGQSREPAVGTSWPSMLVCF